MNNTQAVTIEASAEDMWPWLVQIGQGRGGFYSYDWLEQLVGADIHNVDRIILRGFIEQGDANYANQPVRLSSVRGC